MWKALLIDVNETLLDLAALDPLFEELFGDSTARRDWFGRVLLSAMTVTATGGYQPFDTIAASALSITGRCYGHEPGTDELKRVGAAMRSLPPHPEVAGALARLRQQGHRLVALTNSRQAVLDEQLTNAGLRDGFDEALSVEAAGALKPSPAVYRYAADHLGATPDELLMIAAHGWDLAGASTVGLATAFIDRPGQYPDPLFPAPRYRERDLDALADAIVSASD
jgi:2-haloacid dehalogenase